jgi:hypothetical protein
MAGSRLPIIRSQIRPTTWGNPFQGREANCGSERDAARLFDDRDEMDRADPERACRAGQRERKQGHRKCLVTACQMHCVSGLLGLGCGSDRRF